jgi:integrase/recombinase XerD
MIGFLSRDEVLALLAAPDMATWCGPRETAMLELLYHTGARVSELIEIRVADVTLAVTALVRLRGKGRKR